MAKPPLEQEARRFLAERWQVLRAAGKLRSAEVRSAARDAGVSERTLWRWLARPDPPQQRAGCYRIFADRASGALDERPELAKVLDQLRPGDSLVV